MRPQPGREDSDAGDNRVSIFHWSADRAGGRLAPAVGTARAEDPGESSAELRLDYEAFDQRPGRGWRCCAGGRQFSSQRRPSTATRNERTSSPGNASPCVFMRGRCTPWPVIRTRRWPVSGCRSHPMSRTTRRSGGTLTSRLRSRSYKKTGAGYSLSATRSPAARRSWGPSPTSTWWIGSSSTST